jgi:N-carbamoyl-L-amino-acid hydrolase
LRVDVARFLADWEALAEIGSTGDGGVHRPALGVSHLEARAWLRKRIVEAGLDLHVDGAGNHSAILACGPKGAPSLLLGSHLDSVPQGGRFDGSLGVLAGLEALRVVRDAGISLPVHLEAIDFTDEEGTLVGLLGSSAMVGSLRQEDLLASRAGGAALQEGLARAGLTEFGLYAAARKSSLLAGYLELHIEQGRKLVGAQADIGIVTRIVGYRSCWLRFVGQADHAGTTAMADRRDAAQGASAFTLAVREIVMKDFAECVANVGDARFVPGAFNIVPAQVAVALEMRAPDESTLDELEGRLLAQARVEAERSGLALEVEKLGGHGPSQMSEVARGALTAASEALGLRHIALASGAGHDAQSLAEVCPAGMAFVPSVEGASHSRREFTRWEDCVNGANVLLQAALRMAIRAGT